MAGADNTCTAAEKVCAGIQPSQARICAPAAIVMSILLTVADAYAAMHMLLLEQAGSADLTAPRARCRLVKHGMLYHTFLHVEYYTGFFSEDSLID